MVPCFSVLSAYFRVVYGPRILRVRPSLFLAFLPCFPMVPASKGAAPVFWGVFGCPGEHFHGICLWSLPVRSSESSMTGTISGFSIRPPTATRSHNPLTQHVESLSDSIDP